MKSKRAALIAAVALVAIVVLAFVGYGALSAQTSASGQATATSQQQTEQADEAVSWLADYDATLYTDQDEPVQLTNIAQGKPLVINFWATWCPYCVEEMPDYQEIYRDYSDRVAFAFADSTDGRRETKEKVQGWLAENGFEDLPVYYDNGLDAEAMFGARSLPTTVVVAADGRILVVQPGKIDPTRMRSVLDALVAS